MQRRTLILALILTLLAAVPIVYAYDLWMETWTEDNIVIAGDLSYNYWLVTRDDSETNVTFSYAVSDGVLNINCSRTGTISDLKHFAIERKIDLADLTSAVFETKVKLNISNSAYLHITIKNSSSSATYLTLELRGFSGDQQFKVYYYNSSELYDSITIMSSVPRDEWHTLKAEIDNRTIYIYYDDAIKAELTTSKDLEDYDEIIIDYYIATSATQDYPHQVYIDYIGFKTQFYDPALTNAFIQLAITLAMIGIALSFVKRAIR